MLLEQATNVMERQDSLTVNPARVLTDGADTLNASSNRQRKTSSRANGSANVLDRKSSNNKKRNRSKNKQVKVKSHNRRIFDSQPFLTRVREDLRAFSPTPSNPREVTRSGTLKNDANNNCHTYRFSIAGTTDFNVNLSRVSSEAAVRIVRDVNNNGIVDKGDVVEAVNSKGETRGFDLNRLATGNYFAQVYKVGAGETDYNLNLRGVFPAAQDPIPFVPVVVKGNLNRTFSSGSNSVNSTDNPRDNYRFRVDSRTIVNASLAGTNTQGASVKIFEIGGSGREMPSGSPLPKGEYLAVVDKVGAGTTEYSLQLQGTPIEGNRVRVSVNRVTALDQFDNSFFEDSRADFYAQTIIDNGARQQSPTVVNNNDARLGLVASQETLLGKRFVDIDLKIFDDDGILPHEEANINPNTSQKSLKVRYDTVTGDVRIDGINATFLRGQPIELTGQGSGKKARVRFFVNHD
jgi:hypothetical protein